MSRVPTAKRTGKVGRHDAGVEKELVDEPPPMHSAPPRYRDGHSPTFARSLQISVDPPE